MIIAVLPELVVGCIHWVYEVLVLLAHWRAGEFNELACSLQGATLYQQSTNTTCFAATCTRYTSLKGHGRPKALLLRVGEQRMPKLASHEAPISPCKPRSVPIPRHFPHYSRTLPTQHSYLRRVDEAITKRDDGYPRVLARTGFLSAGQCLGRSTRRRPCR